MTCLATLWLLFLAIVLALCDDAPTMEGTNE